MSPAPIARGLLWLQPVLSALLLGALRLEWLRPRFAPAALLAVFPLAALVLAVMAKRRGERWGLWVIIVALVELLWNVVLLAIVGFGIAWRTL